MTALITRTGVLHWLERIARSVDGKCPPEAAATVGSADDEAKE